ncbi:MAG: hypothetical protein O9327_02375 [Polaromonas sp.]|nr:hypothetical protein [Polaromonas sp.]
MTDQDDHIFLSHPGPHPEVAERLARTESMLTAMQDAMGDLQVNPQDLRATVTFDALLITMQHGDAIRILISADLGPSAIGVLRMQYESLLRAVWALFAASESSLAKLAAPLTPGTLKAAKNMGMPQDLLEAVEASPAPADIKRNLREFRTSSWDVLNSSIHAGLHALRRSEGALPQELLTTLIMANALTYTTIALMTIVGGQANRQRELNVIAVSFPDCMPARHHPA